MKHYYRKTHHLKTHPQHFALVCSGEKRFELRKDDREYHVGDLIILEEWEPEDRVYTSGTICAVVTCLLRGDPWLQPGYVALGIKVLE